MKMYKKSDLTINDGFLVSKDGDIILPDINIVNQANELETVLQQSEYIAAQPEATPMPSLDGFKRVSIKDSKTKFTTATPLLDGKQAEAMAIMNELDDVMLVEKANEMLSMYGELIDFVDNDFVVDCGDSLYRFDTPLLGSVLELTKEDVVDVIARACGMREEGITKHDMLVNPFTNEVIEDVVKCDEEDVDEE